MGKTVLTGKHFWYGNTAIAEGAIAAGCRFFGGYPITPASEIIEIFSKRMPALGRVSMQLEDEISSLAAVKKQEMKWGESRVSSLCLLECTDGRSIAL